MKLLYTDIQYDMTEILVGEAVAQADAGKRVFYIAPNSLSFEKERAVLELLRDEASFSKDKEFFCDYGNTFCSNGSLFCVK